ncbi:hypothetical protein EV426DRAFT_703632 [Tirmania nivea]|nr:hypothetical protein EV426DRAFT_703632 [Tirmania nivea]
MFTSKAWQRRPRKYYNGDIGGMAVWTLEAWQCPYRKHGNVTIGGIAISISEAWRHSNGGIGGIAMLI